MKLKKMLIAGAIGAVVLVYVVKKTDVFSYASCALSQASATVKEQVPTKFELERLRHEVAALDNDVNNMTRPIAEYRVAIRSMKQDIAKTEANIAAQKKDMAEVVTELKVKKHLVINGNKVSEERVKLQLHRDMESIKALEKSVLAQQQVLEAKEKSLRAMEEQIAKVLTVQREYGVALAELEAEEETLKIAQIGSSIKIDNNRTTKIKSSIDDIRRRLAVAREQNEIVNGNLANLPLNQRATATPTLDEILAYAEGQQPANKTETVAQSQK